MCMLFILVNMLLLLVCMFMLVCCMLVWLLSSTSRTRAIFSCFVRSIFSGSRVVFFVLLGMFLFWCLVFWCLSLSVVVCVVMCCRLLWCWCVWCGWCVCDCDVMLLSERMWCVGVCECVGVLECGVWCVIVVCGLWCCGKVVDVWVLVSVNVMMWWESFILWGVKADARRAKRVNELGCYKG